MLHRHHLKWRASHPFLLETRRDSPNLPLAIPRLGINKYKESLKGMFCDTREGSSLAPWSEKLTFLICIFLIPVICDCGCRSPAVFQKDFSDFARMDKEQSIIGLVGSHLQASSEEDSALQQPQFSMLREKRITKDGSS